MLSTAYRGRLPQQLCKVAPELLPFVRLLYGSPCTYCWWDSAGRCRDVPEHEGCEQEDDRCGSASNLGKTCVIAVEAGLAPLGIAEL